MTHGCGDTKNTITTNKGLGEMVWVSPSLTSDPGSSPGNAAALKTCLGDLCRPKGSCPGRMGNSLDVDA